MTTIVRAVDIAGSGTGYVNAPAGYRFVAVGCASPVNAVVQQIYIDVPGSPDFRMYVAGRYFIFNYPPIIGDCVKVGATNGDSNAAHTFFFLFEKND